MSEENPRLTSVEGDQVILICSNKFKVGRNLRSDYVLNSIYSSRNHFELEKVDTGWILRDSSSNGTKLNGKVIKGTFHELKHGDIISLDKTEIKLRFELEVNTTVIRGGDESVVIVEDSKSTTKRGTEQPVINSKRQKIEPNYDELFDDELVCSICSEMYIKPVSLMCSHTFCEYCIGEWKKKKQECPMCRIKITGTVSALTLNNYIEKLIDKMSENYREHWTEIVKSRSKITPQ